MRSITVARNTSLANALRALIHVCNSTTLPEREHSSGHLHFSGHRSLFCAQPHEIMSDLSNVDQARLDELARKAIKRSGNQFFKSVEKRTAAFVEALVAESVDEETFEAVADVLTADNLILLARFYAGEIVQPKKRAHGGETLMDKVKAIQKNDAARKALDVIFIATYLDAAQDECDERAAAAEESDFWAKDYAEIDPSEMWEGRAQAIEEMKPSWIEAATAAMEGKWDELVANLCAIEEVCDP